MLIFQTEFKKYDDESYVVEKYITNSAALYAESNASFVKWCITKVDENSSNLTVHFKINWLTNPIFLIKSSFFEIYLKNEN